MGGELGTIEGGDVTRVDSEIYAVVGPGGYRIIAELSLALVGETAQHCRLTSAATAYEYAWTLREELWKVRRLLVERKDSVTQLLGPGGEGTTKDNGGGIIARGGYTLHSGVHPF
jgi:hypothetical protein